MGLATLAVAVAVLAFAARADAIIVWSDAGSESSPDTLASAHRDGSGLDEFYVNTKANAHSVFGVAVGANHVYWADRSGYIGRANLDGTNTEPHFITTNGGRPLDVALGNGSIYWTNATGGTIGRANRDGSNVDQFFIFTQYNAATGGSVSGLTVDDSFLYWVNNKGGGGGRTGSIGRAAVDGNPQSVKQNFIPGLPAPDDVAVNGNKIFWTGRDSTTGPSTIGDAFLNGTGADQNYISLGTDDPLGITLGASHIYWATPQGAGGSIGRANVDGTGVEKRFITGSSPAWGIAITPKPAARQRH